MRSRRLSCTLALSMSVLAFSTAWADFQAPGRAIATIGPSLALAVGTRLTKAVVPRKEPRPYRFIANGEFKAMLDSDGQQGGLSGRISLYLQADPEMLEDGQIAVQAINLVYDGVPPGALGEHLKSGGGLGFAVDRAKGLQTLKYDPKSGAIHGAVRGHIDLSALNRFATPQQDGDLDSYQAPRQPARLRVLLALERPFDLSKADGEVVKAPARARLSLEADALPKFDLPSYKILHEELQLVIDFTRFVRLRVLRELCVQPVRIGWFKFNWNGWIPTIVPRYSGAGLAFGMPGADTEWAKADVSFDVQDWMTVWNAGFREVSANSSGFLTQEESDLIDTVDEAGCVEVFFIESFDPQGTHGGGATVGSGTSSAKIISSDNNAVFGIDLTHLAHELGHVVGLGHPGNPGGLTAGSTGTLMCPSGFMNDNPQVNSRDNRDNASNPLFRFRFSFGGGTPDCQNSADCGSC